jgi:hypothetical protein
MIRGIITTLLLFMSSSVFCQVNLVKNGDFEQYSSCPQANDNITLCNYWSSIDSLATQFETCVPDYCHVCGSSVYNANTIPLSRTYWQYPHSGKGMAQVVMFYNESSSFRRQRDYLQGRLYRKLIAGKSYCFSFYVNLAEASFYAIKDIGAYMDNGGIDTASKCWMAQVLYTPQVINKNGIISDTMLWTRIQGSFIANGNEGFITIGNFKDKAHTSYIQVPQNSFNDSAITSYNGSFYLIDDVSVVESTTVADAGPDKHVGYGDSVYIGRPMSEAIWCDWRVLGSSAIIGQGPGIWVKPKTTTYYEVSQTLCGYTTKDTVKVEVWAAGVSSVTKAAQQYTLLPNPNDGNMQLMRLRSDDTPVTIKVYNQVGQLVSVSTKTFEGKVTDLSLSHIVPGLYYITLQDASGETYKLSFVKK